MADHSNRRNYEDYSIGWICAIHRERMAAKAALDEEHPPLPSVLGDDNNYLFGRIGPHNVVVASLPSGTYGTNAAAVTANQMSRTFPHLKFGLMVGIGGGVPKMTGDSTSQLDIRLGDVAVGFPNGSSPGVIQYDLGKTKEGLPPERTGSLNKPPRVLLTAVAALKVYHDNRPQALATQVSDIVRKIGQHNPVLSVEYSMPPIETDVLFATGSIHQGSGDTCESCDSSSTIPRKTRKDPQKPTVHYGTIASGNQVLRDSVMRDRLRDEDSIICVEMEAAGLDSFPSLVIRGVCDYADSHKAKQWQPYAAVTAAAYAKDLLIAIPPEAPTETTIKGKQGSERVNQYWSVPRSSHPYFTGRREICERLAAAFCHPATDELRPSGQKRFVITGLGGTGKSEVCLKFVEDYRNEFWGIFWVDVSDNQAVNQNSTNVNTSSLPAAEKDFLKIGKVCGAPGDSIDDIKTWLSNCSHRWLLILDNADNPAIDYAQFIPSGDRGNVIFTSRNRSCGVYQTVGHYCLDMLPSDHARDLLLRASQLPGSYPMESNATADTVVEKLGSHTLALVQAGAYIRQRQCSLEEYANLFSQQQEKMMKTDFGQLKSTYGSIHETFEVSIKYLESMGRQDSEDALQLLNILAFMHFEGVSEYMMRQAAEHAKVLRNRPNTHSSFKRLDKLCIENTLELPGFFLRCDDEKFDWVGWREACSTLESLALLSITRDVNSFSLTLHPLVRDWLSSRQCANSKIKNCRIACSIVSLSTRESNRDDICRTLYPHLQACTRDFEQFFEKNKTIPICKLTACLWWIPHRLQDKNLANLMLNSLDEALRGPFSNQIDDIGELQYMQALALRQAGDKQGSKALLEQVLERREKIYGPDHRRLETVRHSLTSVKLALSDTESGVEIIKSMEERLTTCEQQGRRRAKDVLRTHVTLARAYMLESRLTEAINILEVGLKDWESKADLDESHAFTAQYELGKAYLRADRFDESIILLEKVVQLRKNLGNPADSSLLSLQYDLARAYRGAKRYDEASEILESIIPILVNNLPPADHKLLGPRYLLARVYMHKKQYGNAIKILEQVAEKEAIIYSPTSAERLLTLERLVRAYYDNAQYQEALDVAEDTMRAASYGEVTHLAENMDVQRKARARLNELKKCTEKARTMQKQNISQAKLSSDVTSHETVAHSETLREADEAEENSKTENHAKPQIPERSDRSVRGFIRKALRKERGQK